jgi:hypothetical protein
MWFVEDHSLAQGKHKRGEHRKNPDPRPAIVVRLCLVFPVRNRSVLRVAHTVHTQIVC